MGSCTLLFFFAMVVSCTLVSLVSDRSHYRATRAPRMRRRGIFRMNRPAEKGVRRVQRHMRHACRLLDDLPR
ncbi:hypothetical protein HMPREF0762_02050 [Slackia exigua ATCC 700122]|uniref:Uncharacterized protein n=1 Tax=Slackia exigua (strain ATCC 700122 / DSM 15923 / CIP 105133 / JCM 11022 / KCTC 5966 / S-7) TaxID=649764 RepID=D0WJM2_SLAES|nr:hypothetical protein HMPREF0762_02050 [Slackia exigua ATCC 700122]